MSYIVKVGENRTYEVRNKKVSKILFNTALVANAVNVDFLVSDFDPTKNMIIVNLYREGKKITLYSDTQQALIFSTFLRGNFALLHPKNGTLTNIVLAKGVAVVRKDVYPYVLDFGKVIDLQKNDYLEVNVQFNASSLVGANLVGGTSSYIDVIEQDDVGYEDATRMIETFTLRNAESRISQNLGSGVRAIYLLNYDKDSVLAADAPMATISLASDKFSYTKTQEQLMAERQLALPNTAENAYRRHCLLLYDGKNGNLNNCSLELITVAANCNVGQNVIIVLRESAPSGLVLNAHMLREADKAERAARHGMQSNINPAANRAAAATLSRV